MVMFHFRERDDRLRAPGTWSRVCNQCGLGDERVAVIQARIALRGDIPRELIWLLLSLNLDPFGAGGFDADLVAAFARHNQGGWMVSVRQGAGTGSVDSGVLCDNPYVAAAVLLSRVIGLADPFLVASEETYALLREAIGMAA